jgi:hypothetical protein
MSANCAPYLPYYTYARRVSALLIYSSDRNEGGMESSWSPGGDFPGV